MSGNPQGVDILLALNTVMLIGGFLGAWWVNTIWGSIKELQSADVRLHEDMAEIKILVAGQYVTRSELEKILTRVFDRLETMNDSLKSVLASRRSGD